MFPRRAFNVVQSDKMRNSLWVLFAGVLGAALLLAPYHLENGAGFGAGVSFADALAALPAPTSPSPSDGASAAQPVILKWSKVTFPAEIAGGYFLEVFGGNFGSIQQIWAPDNSYAFPESTVLLAGQEHQWRVRACFGVATPSDTESQCGPWSSNGANWKFTPTLAKPKLVSPANTLGAATPAPVTLKWEQAAGADRYNVILNKTSGSTPFSHTFSFPEVPANATSFAIPSSWIELNNSYTWQVIPLRGNTPGPASDLWQFFVALPKPTLVAPGKDAVFAIINRPVDIEFEWEGGMLGAGAYFLEVFQGDSRIREKWEPGNKVTLDGFLQGTYAWQVTACQAKNVACGSTSERREFSVVQDRTAPRVESFAVEPDAPDWASKAEVSWRVSDTGGSHLKQVEVWRALYDENTCATGRDKDEEGKDTCVWEERADMRRTAPTEPYVDAWTCDSNESTESKDDDCPTESPQDGVYWYGVHVLDRAGNLTTESRPVKVQVDATPPTIAKFEKTNPAGADPVNIENRTLTIEYEVADALSGLRQVELWRKKASEGNEAWALHPSIRPKTFSGTTDATPGSFTDSFSLGVEETYTYGLHVVDRAGNRITEADAGKDTITVKVDTKAPSLASCNLRVDVRYGETNEEGTRVLLLAPSDAQLTKKYFWEFGDDSEPTSIELSFINHRYRPGRYTAKLRAQDEAGNVSSQCTATVDIDDEAPRIREFTVEPDAPDWVNTQNPNPHVSWEATDSGGSGLSKIEIYRAFDANKDGTLQDEEWKNPGNGQANPIYEKTEGFTSSARDTGLYTDNDLTTGGVYWYGIHATDRAGKWDKESRPVKVQVDKTPPACTIGFSGRALKVSFVPGGREEGAKYTWDFGDGTKKTDSGLGIDHTYSAVEKYTVKLVVEDKAGNMSNCEGVVDIGALPPEEAPPGAELPGAGAECDPGADPRFVCQKGLKCEPRQDDPTKGECTAITVVPGEFPNPLRATTFAAVLNTILNFLFMIALVAAPLAILASAFLFVTASGNPEQVSRAKKALVWTFVGLLVILLSKGIVAVVQGLLGV